MSTSAPGRGFAPTPTSARSNGADSRSRVISCLFMRLLCLFAVRFTRTFISRIVLKSERRLACNVAAGEGGTPIFLHVRDHKVGAFKVTDAGRTFGVVHRVGHIANQRDVLAELDHLADREWPPEHTHVQVDAAKNHVLDAALS